MYAKIRVESVHSFFYVMRILSCFQESPVEVFDLLSQKEARGNSFNGGIRQLAI